MTVDLPMVHVTLSTSPPEKNGRMDGGLVMSYDPGGALTNALMRKQSPS